MPIADIAPPYCKPCLDRGFKCHATRRLNDENWCEQCVGGEECVGVGLAVTEAKPIDVTGELLKPAPEARDLVSVLSKVLAGLFDGQITPKQASAMCQASNTMMKAMEMAERFKNRKKD